MLATSSGSIIRWISDVGRSFAKNARSISASDCDASLATLLRKPTMPSDRVVPGITALQALTAAHAIPLNTLGAPVLVTTGRRLIADGWPAGVDTVAVMLDAGAAFRTVDPAGVRIWWGAYLGMAQEALAAGPLATLRDTIPSLRAELRARHGWIMDSYLLRRGTAD